jgi:hypothetical protein
MAGNRSGYFRGRPQLTKSASLAGESEKISPTRRRRLRPGETAQRVAPPERGTFPEYWPFRGAPAWPPSTTGARELVADKFGSAIRFRTNKLLVNSGSEIIDSPAFLGSDLPFCALRGMNVSTTKERSEHKHADGNQIPAPSHAGGVGLAVRRLAGVLAGRMGQIPFVLSSTTRYVRAIIERFLF